MRWRPQSKPGYMADLNEALWGRRIEYVDCETTFVALVLDDGNRVKFDMGGGKPERFPNEPEQGE